MVALAVVAAVPVLLSCRVKLAGTPTVKLPLLAVLLSVSWAPFTVVVAALVLLPTQVTGAPLQSGSLVPEGGTTVAVKLAELAVPLDTVHWMVRVTLPPLGTVTVVQVPVPVAPGAMVPTLKVPADGVYEHPVRPAGSLTTRLSVSLARIADGPALLTVSV